MEGEIRFERDSLYDEVWAHPVSTVSKRYGLSDNGLRKICKDLEVPLPPFGYWAKVRAGQKVTRTPLGEHDGPTTYIAPPKPKNVFERASNIEEEEKAPESRIVPTADDEWRHRFVRALDGRLAEVDNEIAEDDRPLMPGERAKLRFAWRYRKDAGVIGCGEGYLPVFVTPVLRRRALSIADALLVALESRGFRVRIENGKTIISCKDVSVYFRMSEMTSKATAGYGDNKPKALGRLRIILRAASYRSCVPQEIKVLDEPGNPLEDQLNHMVSRLRRGTLGYEEREKSRQSAAKREREERDRRECLQWHEGVAAEAARREIEGMQTVFAEADAWGVIERCHRYIEHIEQSARDWGMLVTADSPVGAWGRRIREACSMFDPTEDRLRTIATQKRIDL